MNLNEFIKETHNPTDRYCMRPLIVCKDGFTMSVQGSSGHYCSPRETSEFYSCMEIGFPSRRDKLLLEYAEDPKRPTETVYGYVPTEVIQAVIDKHKGIDEEKTFKNGI